MTKAGKQMIDGAKEALAIARGEIEPARVHHFEMRDGKVVKRAVEGKSTGTAAPPRD